MDGVRLKERIISRVEVTTITALQGLLILVVAVATVVLYLLFVHNLFTQAAQIDSVTGLLPAMQRSFAGVLTVVLGLELLETLKTYFTEHRVRLEVILVVAIIATGRHVIQVDFEHTSGTALLGLAAVIVALTFGYFLVKKSQVPEGAGKLRAAASDTNDQ